MWGELRDLTRNKLLWMRYPWLCSFNNFFFFLQINGSVNVTCNKLMLQNLNTDQSWHQGDSDYTEPIEIIAVVTESLTGMWLCHGF